jgi:hypothetical protein
MVLGSGVETGEAGVERGVELPLSPPVAVRWLKLREGGGGGDLIEVRAEFGGEGRWGSFGGTGDG